MCNPIEQITEEDEENYSKTNSEKPIEEDEQSPTHEAEDSNLHEPASDDEEADEYDLKFPA